MKSADSNFTQVKYVESLMLEKFKTEPFHNLYFFYKQIPKTLKFGGTCSDKTLSFFCKLSEIGIEAHLHSAFIKNKEIHRMVSVIIDGKTYYADVGNGWPSIKLFPEDYEIEYTCYGLIYSTVINEKSLDIYLTRNGQKYLSVVIPFRSRSHEDIMDDIKNRFDEKNVYPFSRGIRFSQIIHENFLFLRGDTLYIYTDNSDVTEISGLDQNNLPAIIKQYFNFDVGKMLKSSQI